MSDIHIRFYGRFVMAKARRKGALTGKVVFLLPDMGFDNSGFAEHRTLMTIPRHHVKVKATAKGLAPTNFLPAFRTLSEGSPVESDLLHWDIRGLTLDLGLTGGLTLTYEEGTEIVDLLDLEALQGRKNVKLNQVHLAPREDGPLRAAVIVDGGSGHASSAFQCDEYSFVTLNDAKDGDPLNDKIVKAPHSQVDVVDIKVSDAPEMLLSFRNALGVSKHVTVHDPNPNGPLTINITNLCAALESDPRYDFEFVQYYKLLENAGRDGSILVPKADVAGGECGNCDVPGSCPYDE